MLLHDFLRCAVVDDDQHIRQHSFFQRRAERADQCVGQLADEPNRVHQQERCVLRRLDAAADRVQRRKQLVLHIHIAARHLVQQCRFARIGVADQRDDGDFVLLAALAAQFALLLHRIQAAAEFRHALADVAAVHFQLRFARPARADAACQPRQHQALPNQAAGLVLQLRQLDLQLALGG